VSPLLEHQLRRHLPDLDPTQPPWCDFLAAVDAAYREAEQDRAFLSHTLEVVSEELTEANERLRAEAESRIAALRHTYRQTLEAQQGMLICLRRTERGFEHTLCRGQLLKRLGIGATALEGRLVEEVAPPAQAAQLNQAYTRAWAGEVVAFSFTTSDGVELFISCRPRFEDGIVREIIASCVEITALKQAEHELRAAKERAEAADRAKSEFLAVMSHEIRTPLNAILGFASLLQQSPLSAEQHTWLETVAGSGKTLLALINDILDFSKIEAGRLTLSPQPVTLASVLDAVLSMFGPRAAAKRLALRLHAAPDLPAAISTDEQRLRQILINLIGNAVKFTEHGSVDLEVSVVAPATAASAGAVVLRFAVRDTGPGIPADQRDRLFKPFSQLDSSSTRSHGGTGLGLVICERLVRMLGGEIGYESTPGAGACFFFTMRALPVAPGPVAAPPPAIAAPAARRLRVLVAEDHPHNQLFMRRALEAYGIAPDLVATGGEAVAATRLRTYDLILMDLQMPDMDGFAAAAAIRRETAPAGRPRIYAVTANVFPEDRRRCLEAGMDGVLTKPLELRELYALLAALEREA